MIRLGAIGLGNRACKYLKYIENNPQTGRLCAVAEPDGIRRVQAVERFGLDGSAVFGSAEELFASGPELDAVIIASPDDTHYRYTLQAVSRGWAVLLEKPVSTRLEDCIALDREVSLRNVHVAVCYVLRFHPFYLKLKEILSDGGLGDVCSVRHIIHIGTDRMTHSFVRGQWSREEESSPIILAKACHDIDILYWLTGRKAVQVSSAGGILQFHSGNAPYGSSARCLDCAVERQCAFSAVDLYLRRNEWNSGFDVFPGETVKDAVMRELRCGRYGRCAFKCGNNVPDRQIVDMVLEGGVPLHLELDGIEAGEGRETLIVCSKGEIFADMRYITVRRYGLYGHVAPEVYDMSGYADMPLHGGADLAVMEDFIGAVSGKRKSCGADLSAALHSHEICFRAEESRKGDSGFLPLGSV